MRGQFSFPRWSKLQKLDFSKVKLYRSQATVCGLKAHVPVSRGYLGISSNPNSHLSEKETNDFSKTLVSYPERTPVLDFPFLLNKLAFQPQQIHHGQFTTEVSELVRIRDPGGRNSRPTQVTTNNYSVNN